MAAEQLDAERRMFVCNEIMQQVAVLPNSTRLDSTGIQTACQLLFTIATRDNSNNNNYYY